MKESPAAQIEARSLSKRYGDFVALDSLSLTVLDREILGLLGPNGAGKSTFIRLLLGAIQPTGGQAMIHGLDCYRQRDQVHKLVSYLPGDARLYRRMKGREVLQFFGRLRGRDNLRMGLELAERLDLDISRRVAAMSTGMRQKLAIAVTLSADTPILILDEPTANLDPTVRNEVLRIVREARDRGATVLFSSHVLSEIEDLCDRVVILRDGQMVHHQDMAELRLQHRLAAQFPQGVPKLPSELEGRATILEVESGWHIIETDDSLGPVLQWLGKFDLGEVRIDPGGLSAIYAKWDGRDPTSSTEAEKATPQHD